jgi:hypothetical protein
MGMKIDLGGLDGFVSEPQCDHRNVDARLEEFHGGGVPQDVRRYPLVPQ